YGGWGYESDTPWWSDLSNTQFALMALDAAELDPASPVWAKAVTFISRCQNLASNPHGFHDDGGFIYSPGEDYWWAGGQSYGSMTAAGVWSLLLSDLPVADARLQAALNWLDNLHYHVDQNYPIGNLWLYYYDLTLAKLHAMAEASGWTSGHPWYDDVSDFLVGNQEADGHWPNIEGDESCDVLTTVEAIMALEVRKIPTSVQRFSWLTFILRSNADLHVYDPLGRHVGMNYDTGEMEIEIPGATFNVDGAQTIQIPGLVAGTYRVRAVGTGTGSYELTVRGGVGDTVLEDETYVETITPATRHDARVMVAMIVGLEIDAVAPPSAVGGIVEIPVSASDAPASAANASGSSSPPYAAIAGAAATAALALTAGGWYARRRWLR
ncbi:MAG: prenyltransferase/squalene oxidase repeat-containing protein, partial [Dehalococcoidia bacterium]